MTRHDGGESRRQRSAAGQERDQERREPDHRAHREIDAAGDDDEALAERDQAEERDQPRQVLQVVSGEELRLGDGESHGQHRGRRDDGEELLHGAEDRRGSGVPAIC